MNPSLEPGPALSTGDAAVSRTDEAASSHPRGADILVGETMNEYKMGCPRAVSAEKNNEAE